MVIGPGRANLSFIRSIQAWTRGQWATSLTRETVPTNNQICGNYLWLYHIIDLKKKPIISFLKRITWSFTCIYKKLKSPTSKDVLCQVWLKLAQWFWRRRFFNFVNVFSVFRDYLPLEKDWTLHLNKLEDENV